MKQGRPEDGSRRGEPRAGRGTDLRTLLIDAALGILEDPDTPLDLRKVAEAADKSRTAPYLVFGKESEGGGLAALRMAVAAEGARMLTRAMDEARASTSDPRFALYGVAHALLSFATEHPRLFRLMFGPEIGTLPVSDGPAGAPHPEFLNLVEARTAAERVVSAVVRHAQARRILPEGDALELSMGAWALMIGVAFLMLDRVLQAAGVRTTVEDGAELVASILTGSATERMTRAALALMEAQQDKGGGAPERPHVRYHLSALGPAAPPPPSASAPPPPTSAAAHSVHYEQATETIANISALRRAARVSSALKGARVLWIDDQPRRNGWERKTLEALDVVVDRAASTHEALERLSGSTYDLVISDIDRDGDPKAGVTALPMLRVVAPETPVVFYVSRLDRQRGTPEGARGITNEVDELLHLVLDVLERRRL